MENYIQYSNKFAFMFVCLLNDNRVLCFIFNIKRSEIILGLKLYDTFFFSIENYYYE